MRNVISPTVNFFCNVYTVCFRYHKHVEAYNKNMVRLNNELNRIAGENKTLNTALQHNRKQLSAMKSFVKSHSTVNADISPNAHGDNHVILLGRFNNADYVQIRTFNDVAFAEVVKHVRGCREYIRAGYTDASPLQFQILREDAKEFPDG